MALVVSILTYPEGFGRYIAGQVCLQFLLFLNQHYLHVKIIGMTSVSMIFDISTFYFYLFSNYYDISFKNSSSLLDC